MLREMSAEEVKREEDMEEMVADMIEDMSVGSKVTEPELAEPDFKENFYNYCMNSCERRGINPKVGYKPEGGQYVIEEDNELYKTNDISQMIQESIQAENEDMRKQAELTYHYLWSKEYIKRLKSDIAKVKACNQRLLEKNRRLDCENEYLSHEYKRLNKKLKKLKRKLDEVKQDLKQYKKVVWKNIKNGKWNNKKTCRLIIKKRNLDDFTHLL